MVAQETQMVYVLDPTAEPLARAKAIAPRANDLHGKTLGLLSNGKLNAGPILELLGDMLGSRYDLKEVVSRGRGSHYGPTPTETLEELAGRCDAVVVGVGD